MEKMDENGSALIVALVILVLLTLIGISITTTSDLDIQISKNEQAFVREFYVADSAWREGVQWLDTRSHVPGLVNKALYISGDDINPNYLNVRNYGEGGNGVYNDSFTTGTEDGSLGSGSSQIPYWYKIGYVNEDAMEGEIAPGFGEGFRRFTFRVTGVANGIKEVEVVVTKVLQLGE